jgi:hypothetical protein
VQLPLSHLKNSLNLVTCRHTHSARTRIFSTHIALFIFLSSKY